MAATANASLLETFPELVVDDVAACTAEVTWKGRPEAALARDAGQLRYRMPGVTLDATVACPDEKRLSQVGFIQFVLDGESRVHYDAGSLVVRFPKLPVIDADASSLPWTFPSAVAPFAPTMRVRTGDVPQGAHPLFRGGSGVRYWASGVAPDLATIERHLKLVVLLGGFDPVRDRFLALRAYEWETRLSVERYIQDDGAHAFRAIDARLGEPRELSRDELRALAPRLAFTSPPANEAQDYWWVPPQGSRTRAVRLHAR